LDGEHRSKSFSFDYSDGGDNVNTSEAIFFRFGEFSYDSCNAVCIQKQSSSGRASPMMFADSRELIELVRPLARIAES
jgi:hypothetical protein